MDLQCRLNRECFGCRTRELGLRKGHGGGRKARISLSEK